MRKAELGLWTNGVEGAIVGHRPIDPGEDDARVDFPTAARGHGPPRGGRRREDPLGCADGRAPLSALPGLVGRSVRHVAVLGEHWLALVGWHAGAFKLKARDRWIGWLPEQQFRRLHLIANNARFLILPEIAS